MHGRSRVSLSVEKQKEADLRERAAVQKKVSLYAQLQSNVLQYHREKRYTADSLQQSAKLLELNPDVNTVWNFRKCAFQHQLAEVGDDAAAKKKLAEEELRLVEKALRNNPKSYGAWHHRKWIVAQGFTPLKREFELLGLLLGLDNRNFHGWDYRRFVVQFSSRDAEAELQYSMEKINEEPRNYSAWHSRSQLLKTIHMSEEEGASAVLDSSVIRTEFELVRQALWTAPDDQSGFMYYQWLLGHTLRPEKPHLLATWPPSGTSVSLHENQAQLLLFFSEPVIGVDDETVIVHMNRVVQGGEVNREAEEIEAGLLGCKAEGIGWEPLTGSLSGGSSVWVLNVTTMIVERGEQGLTFRLTIGRQLGIKSISGVSLRCGVEVTLDIRGKRNTRGCMDSFSERQSAWWPSARLDGDMELKRAPIPAVAMAYLGNYCPGKLDRDVEESVDTWRQEVLLEEITMCRELLAEETESVKWPSLTLVRLLLASAKGHGTSHGTEPFELFKKLIQVDPDHKEYYEDQLGKLRLQEALASPDSLGERWHIPAVDDNMLVAEQDPAVQKGWLRLSHLGLGKLEGLHRLLWVQQLDLSNNRLRSAHGLESLQQLTSVDLSHNRITFGSAVTSLAFLPHLQLLNLSYNLIGSCKNNTYRYCSSCLVSKRSCCSTGNSIKDEGRVATSGESSVDELLRGFGSLPLKVFDLRGNDITQEASYRTTLKNMIPSLDVLDGEHFV